MCDCRRPPHVTPTTFEEEWAPPLPGPRAMPGWATLALLAAARQAVDLRADWTDVRLDRATLRAFLAEWLLNPP